MVTLVDDTITILFTRTAHINSKSLKRKVPKLHKCSCCGKDDQLTIHHIIPISMNPNLKYKLDNMVVLCEDCHNEYGHCGYTGKYYNPRVLEDIKDGDSLTAFNHRIPLHRR